MEEYKEKKPSKEENNVMLKVATFIVDRRNLFFLLFGLAIIFCVIASNWVRVENALSAYLPETSETRIGIDLMEDQFVTYGSAKIMVTNIVYEDAEVLAQEIAARGDVSMLTFDDTADHYHNFSALYDVTFRYPETDERALTGLQEIEDKFADYDIYVSTSMGDQSAETINQEMQTVSALVVVIVLVVLVLTSQTYAEIPVLLLTFGAAALLSAGTNFVLGTISFVSDSVTIVLQLALSIDYAVIFCNRYKEEHEKLPIREADIIALSKAIPEISSSSLTTIGGLIAMMFMQFGIGRDMGICLIKAILLSLLAVFLLMPGLLMIFGPLMDKTKHQSFVPKIPFVGKFNYHTRHIVPLLFVLTLFAAFYFQSKCPFVYGYSKIETPIKNDTQIASEMITESFGESNFVALIVPAGNYDKEKELIGELTAREEVKSVQGIANIDAKGGYCLGDKLTARDFSEVMDIDYEACQLLYAAYAINDENYAKLINGASNYGVPFIDMVMFVHDEVEEGYITLDEDKQEVLDEAYDKIKIARDQLQGEEYSRMLVYLNLPLEGEETFAFLDEMHRMAQRLYPEGQILVAGESTSQMDLKKTFDVDNTVVSVVSILAVLAVLLFTFKSAGMPVLLIVVIQGAIWINFAFPYLQQTNIFFMTYLIVSSIQMGANIDYAIVISGRFMELKHQMDRKSAIIETMNFAFPTIITSGSMLALAGFSIGQLSSDGAICGIGQCLGRGTVISIILVMFVLPQILLIGEKIIDLTSFQVSAPIKMESQEGLMRIDGHIQGQIQGVMVGEVHAIVRGNVNAFVQMGEMRPITREEANVFALLPATAQEKEEALKAAKEEQKAQAATDATETDDVMKAQAAADKADPDCGENNSKEGGAHDEM